MHLHDARRRHWDLRLELGGVLKSFAVPRGPSLDPADKRLAVETEDHPIEYLDFEAVIPEGNYGAGAMIVWDRGRVRYLEGSGEDGVGRGKIDFELSGYKLRGRFGLALTGQEGRRRQKGKGLDVHGDPTQEGGSQREWLLFKKSDAFAKKGSIVDDEPRSVLSALTVEELAESGEVAKHIEERARELGAKPGSVDGRRLAPMLCTTSEEVHDQPGYLYELKLDGFRVIADKRGDDAALFFRKLGSANAFYPEIVRAVRALAPERVVLDGEVVAFDDGGRPSFQRLQGRMQAPRSQRFDYLASEASVVYVVFDLLALGPFDLRPLPLAARKKLLAELVRGKGALRVLDHLEGGGRRLYEFCERERLEGMVAKRADSAYVSGPRRSGDWIKIKCDREDDFVVIGFTAGEGTRSRMGALDLASYTDGELRVRGKVGSGLDERTIDALLARLSPRVIDQCAAIGDLEPAPRGRKFVPPELVVDVRYGGWTDDGRLRHPVFLRVRDDVRAEECTASPRADGEPEASPDDVVAEAPLPAEEKPRSSRVQITNPKKVFWPDDKLTKRDLFEYYGRIAPTLLPYLQDRPVALVRYPDGIAGKSFYQWNVPVGTPSWVQTITIVRDDEEDRKVCFLVNDVDTLLYIANLGCIPIHVLASRSRSLDSCDFITFDFDIGSSPIAHAVELALSLRGLLDHLGLVGYPKTSGQSGLHVLVPMGPGVSFDTAKALVELLGRLLEKRHLKIGTMERRINQRGQRVYIDTGQTGRSRTIVAPYSVRAHKGATVSTPLEWDEVGATLSPTRWSMLSVPARVEAGADPMRPMLDARPDVARAVKRLEALLQSEARRSS